MLHDLILYIPFLFSVFWLMLNGVLSFKTRGFWLSELLLLVFSLLLMIDAYYNTQNGTPRFYVWFNLLYQLVAPGIVPLTVYYCKKRSWLQPFRPFHFLLVTIPVCMFMATGILTIIIGTQDICEYMSVANVRGVSALFLFKGLPVYGYYVWSTIVLRILFGADLMFLMVFCFVVAARKGFTFARLTGFFKKGARLEPVELQLVPAFIVSAVFLFKQFLFRDYLNAHPALGPILAIIITLCLFVLYYINLFGAKSSITLKDLAGVMRYNYATPVPEKVEEEVVEEIGDSPVAEAEHRDLSLAESIFANAPEDTDGLMGRFQRLMQEEHLYLQPGLSLDDVAEHLNTNKTYVSKMVNTGYNMGFPELLNILRIDYAQHYILLNRDATQDIIARDCGFFSASSFNTVFKRITGMTPKLWVASHLHI